MHRPWLILLNSVYRMCCRQSREVLDDLFGSNVVVVVAEYFPSKVYRKPREILLFTLAKTSARETKVWSTQKLTRTSTISL